MYTALLAYSCIHAYNLLSACSTVFMPIKTAVIQVKEEAEGVEGCNMYTLSFDLSKNVEYWNYQRASPLPVLSVLTLCCAVVCLEVSVTARRCALQRQLICSADGHIRTFLNVHRVGLQEGFLRVHHEQEGHRGQEAGRVHRGAAAAL